MPISLRQFEECSWKMWYYYFDGHINYIDWINESYFKCSLPTDILAGYVQVAHLLIIAIYCHRLLTERLGLNNENIKKHLEKLVL